MTNEEARTWFIQESEKDITEGEFQAFSRAIEALGKQIPKKLKNCGFGIGKGWCSYCHAEIDYDHKYEPDCWHFCPNCGQAID